MEKTRYLLGYGLGVFLWLGYSLDTRHNGILNLDVYVRVSAIVLLVTDLDANECAVGDFKYREVMRVCGGIREDVEGKRMMPWCGLAL